MKLSAFITLGAFEMAKRAFLHNPEPQINKPAAETAENVESATETPENRISTRIRLYRLQRTDKGRSRIIQHYS